MLSENRFGINIERGNMSCWKVECSPELFHKNWTNIIQDWKTLVDKVSILPLEKDDDLNCYFSGKGFKFKIPEGVIAIKGEIWCVPRFAISCIAGRGSRFRANSLARIRVIVLSRFCVSRSAFRDFAYSRFRVYALTRRRADAFTHSVYRV